MTQEYINGMNLKQWLEKENPSFSAKKKVMRSLLMWWAHLTFRHGVVHSDPHYGNVMVTLDSRTHEPISIAFIDWGQTDIFQDSFWDNNKTGSAATILKSKSKWLQTFSQLLIQMHVMYDEKEKEFATSIKSVFTDIQAKLSEHGGIYRLFQKQFFDTINLEKSFQEVFMQEIANIMRQLGFETENDNTYVLSGLALSALNNDPRFQGADKSKQLVSRDAVKMFPKNACLIFRAFVALSGMVNDHIYDDKDSGKHLLDGNTLVQIWKPFYS